MSLKLLLDENVRGPLWQAIRRHNVVDPSWALDVVRVGDLAVLPLGTDDHDILKWCSQHQRILVSHDLETMPMHFQTFLQQGQPLPGVWLIRKGHSFRIIIDQLVLMTYGGTVDEFKDQLLYLPM